MVNQHYIDVESCTNITNNYFLLCFLFCFCFYLQKKFDLGRPSVFLFSQVSMFVWQHVFSINFFLFTSMNYYILVNWYTKDMKLNCTHFVAQKQNCFLFWKVTFAKIVHQIQVPIFILLLFLTVFLSLLFQMSILDKHFFTS